MWCKNKNYYDQSPCLWLTYSMHMESSFLVVINRWYTIPLVIYKGNSSGPWVSIWKKTNFYFLNISEETRLKSDFILCQYFVCKCRVCIKSIRNNFIFTRHYVIARSHRAVSVVGRGVIFKSLQSVVTYERSFRLERGFNGLPSSDLGQGENTAYSRKATWN